MKHPGTTHQVAMKALNRRMVTLVAELTSYRWTDKWHSLCGEIAFRRSSQVSSISQIDGANRRRRMTHPHPSEPPAVRCQRRLSARAIMITSVKNLRMLPRRTDRFAEGDV